MFYFKNKVAVITGAASGLGKALAEALHRQGAHLALIDLDENELIALQKTLVNKDTNITIHCLDVSKEASIAEARTDILSAHARLDLLINNAGVSTSCSFSDIDLSDFRRIIEVNFWSAVYFSKYFLPDLINHPNSRLVNISSNFALMGFPGKTAYGASKGALSSFTNSLKTELVKANPKVCLVVPPPMDTGLVRNGLHSNSEKQAAEIAFLIKNGMSVEKAAEIILRKVARGQFRIIVGPLMFWADCCSRLFPSWLHGSIRRSDKLKAFT